MICKVYADQMCDRKCHACKNGKRCKRIIVDFIVLFEKKKFPCLECKRYIENGFDKHCLCIRLKEWYEKEKRNL